MLNTYINYILILDYISGGYISIYHYTCDCISTHKSLPTSLPHKSVFSFRMPDF